MLDGLKFDLRINILLKSVCPLKIFTYKEGLARFLTVRYERPNKLNISDICIQLTNYAINKLNPNFIFNQSQELDILGHKRSQMSVLKLLKENNHDLKKFGARSRRS